MRVDAAAAGEHVVPTADSRSLHSQISTWALRSTAPGQRRQTIFMDKFVLQLAVVFLGYLIAGKLGQATTTIRSGNLGPVWPASGIALAGVLACGSRVWPAIAASSFIVAFQSPVLALTAVGQAAGATLAALAGGFL